MPVSLQAEPACLLIADISGYTGYLAGVELEHAQDILADLISTVVSALRPRFRLAKLEGDAAFTWAATPVVDGSLLLDTIERCYFGFRRRRRDVRQATSCPCDACVRIPDLDLKFVVHHGSVIRQKVAGREELLGSDVVVVHRMLKNEVVARTGIAAYALISEACVAVSGLDAEALGMRPHTETYEHVGEVRGWVHDLEARWREEDERKRVIVTAKTAAYQMSMATDAPPQVAWEFVTSPGRRMQWQAGVTGVDLVESTGNRRGVGATNHCLHGPDAVIEEILDWRPYDYVTDRSTLQTPMGPIRFLTTTEVEPTATGSIVHMRFAAPTTAKEKKIWDELGGLLAQIVEQSRQGLEKALALDAAERAALAAESPEPALPPRDRSGLLADVQPILILS